MIVIIMMTTMTMIMFPLEMASPLVGSGLELADAAFQPESGGSNCHHRHRCGHQHIVIIIIFIAIVIIIIVVVIILIMITDH